MQHGVLLWVIHVGLMRPTNSWHVRCTSDSSRISALQRFDEKCHYRTYASQQIARFQGPHPQTDSEMGMQAAARIHSISRSARSMIDCGIERLSAVAVFMLDQHLELCRLFDRQISGFRPFENLVPV